jgi:photosystem II stability/assembly factor-like uncharacterized protein
VLAVALFLGAGIGLWHGFFLPLSRNKPHEVRPVVTARTFLDEGVAGGIAVGEGAVWVPERDVLARLDPVTLALVARIPLPGDGESRAIAVGEGAVWVGGTNGIIRIDPETNRVSGTIPLHRGAPKLAVGDGAVWAMEPVLQVSQQMRIVRIDPATNQTRSFTVSAPVTVSKWFGLAAGFGSVWTSNFGGKLCPSGGCLLRLDPTTGKVQGTVDGVAGQIALDQKAVWVNEASQLVRVDPATNRVTARIQLPGPGDELAQVAAGSEYAWTGVSPGKIVVIDGRTNRLIGSAFNAGPFPYAIAASDSSAWVTSSEGDVARVDLVPCRASACRRSPSPPPTPAGVATVSLEETNMISSAVGWATGSIPGHINAVLHTTDGGVRWTDVSPQPRASWYPVTPFFLDGSHAWLGTARRHAATIFRAHVVTIYRTGDGGRTWHTSSFRTKFAYGSLFFVDPSHGWFLAGEGGGAMGYNPVQVYRTEDGGAHWTLVSTSSPVPSSQAPGQIGDGCDKMGIAFASTSTGWVGTACVSGYVLYESRDGGATWSEQALPDLSCPQGCIVSAPTFVSVADGFLDVEPGPLYATHDGGSTWTKVGLPAGVGTPDFVDASDGFAFGRARLWVTRDGGSTWTEIVPDHSLSNASVEFVSSRVGFALVSGARYLLRTDDGGRTWQTVSAALGS